MANIAADFPTAVHDNTDISAFANEKTGSTDPTHTEVHGKIEEEVTAIQTKLGTGDSTATANTVLKGTGAGTTEYGKVSLADEVTETAGIGKGDILAGIDEGEIGVISTDGASDGDVPTLQEDGSIAFETPPGAGGGESNTASNSGTGGVGIVLAKDGVDLPFKSINAGSAKVTITDDTGNDEIDIDIDEDEIELSSSNVNFDVIGTPTYKTVQDLSNGVQSAGIISGGTITDAGSGNVDISAITGIIKSANSAIGANLFFDLSAQEDVALTDSSVNYVSVDYNSGTPQIIVGVTNTANGHTIFNLGKVYREGTDLDILSSGLRVYDLSKRIQQRNVEAFGTQFVSGAIVGETGTRNITISAGVMYAGYNRITTDAVDTSDGDSFEYYYYTGSAWTESDQTAIDNTQYNNIASGLATLANNRYGVHWVYKGTNSNTYVIYGQGSYTLIRAQSVQPPSSLPDHVEEMGVLRAKIIIAKSGTSFTEIESIADTTFTSSTASNHNELAGLQGGTADEYYHMTSAQNTVVGNTSGTNTGDEVSASTTVEGIVELATATETTTGTDTGRAVTPDGLAGSIHGKVDAEMVVFDFTTDTATGDGKFYFTVGEKIAGMNLISVHAKAITAGTTGTTDIQLNNVTQTADILSTKITIDSTETGSDTAATPAVIDTNEDDMTLYDLIRVDVDAVSTTPAKGLILRLTFQLP